MTVPILADDHRIDRAVYWERDGDGGDGQHTFADPIELEVRWKWRRSETQGTDGISLILDAQVTADRRLVVGSKLWLAPDWGIDAIEQWYNDGSAGHADEVMRVATQGETWDAKGIEVRYTAGLEWWRD